MVPGFSSVVVNEPDRSSAVVALAGPWDFDDGDGKHVKICGDYYSKTSCQGVVLLCKDCRMCRWLDSFGTFEECNWWYPCGGCVGADW
jgi:hypothetical protein